MLTVLCRKMSDQVFDLQKDFDYLTAQRESIPLPLPLTDETFPTFKVIFYNNGSSVGYCDIMAELLGLTPPNYSIHKYLPNTKHFRRDNNNFNIIIDKGEQFKDFQDCNAIIVPIELSCANDINAAPAFLNSIHTTVPVFIVLLRSTDNINCPVNLDKTKYTQIFTINKGEAAMLLCNLANVLYDFYLNPPDVVIEQPKPANWCSIQ